MKIFQLILYFMRQSEGAATRRLMMDIREKTGAEGGWGQREGTWGLGLKLANLRNLPVVTMQLNMSE